MKKIATIKEIVEYGLNTIDANKTIEVNLKDIVFVHRVLEEYMRFFHNPDHYPDMNNLKTFLGQQNSGGAFDVLNTAVYRKTSKMIPKDIENDMSDGIFDNPLMPEYYNTQNE